MPDGCADVFVTAQGDVMIAGPANTFYDLPACPSRTVSFSTLWITPSRSA
jgi:hypothetical protein